MQAVIEEADDGLPTPDQHRIMDPLCDVDPFRRTPAWPPAQNVRLAHSPHILNLQPPYGLGQKVFCPLGSRPRVRGSSVKPTSWVMQTPLRPCPLPSVAPCGTADFPSPARACKCSALSRLRNRPDSFTVGEPPLSPVLPPAALHACGGRAAASRRPGRPRHQVRHSPHTPKLACRLRSTRHASPDASAFARLRRDTRSRRRIAAADKRPP